jgi:hypothetical protein
MGFSFRIQFVLSKQKGIASEDVRCQIVPSRFVLPCILRSTKNDEKIKDASELVLESSKYKTIEDATKAGETVKDALTLTLASLKVGADLGFKPSGGVITNEGIKYFEAQTKKRVLQGGLGLKVYETEPSLIFMQPSVELKVSSPISKLVEVLNYAIENPRRITEKEKVALQLFNTSFFEDAIEARFLTLVMAIEVLLEFQPRPEIVRAHVNNLINITENNETIEKAQKDSLLGSLKWLFHESINQAGRRLATERLNGRLYNNMVASKFFTHCYDLRCKLVHGSVPVPNPSEVGTAILQLEFFVSDLLSGDLIETESKNNA